MTSFSLAPAILTNAGISLQFASLLGIPIKDSKTVLPTTIASVHGIKTDRKSMQALLPRDKIFAHTCALTHFAQYCSACLCDLSIACKVIHPGRPFIHCLINAIHGVLKSAHYIHILVAIRKGLRYVVIFLIIFQWCLSVVTLAGDFLPTTITIYWCLGLGVSSHPQMSEDAL